MLVWLPADAARDALGELPAGVELVDVGVDGPLPDRASDVEVFVLSPMLRGRLVEALPQLTSLRLVHLLNAGVDWVPALPPGVTLCNAAGVHDGPVAEWVVAVILAMEKRLPHFIDQQRAARWDASANLAFASGAAARDIAGSRVVIVGHGAIGRAVEERLVPFGADVRGVARRPRDGVAGPAAVRELLPTADVVVLLAPATDETRLMVDRDFLATMKQGALLVSAARGSLIDTDALLDALHAGQVRAALDGADPEPLPDSHPLWTAPGLLLTPHVAGSSAHWQRRAYVLIGDQLRNYAAGAPLINVRTEGY